MTWRTVSENPMRVEHAELGAVEDLPGALVKLEPRCGHERRAMSIADGRKQLEERSGLCYRCFRAEQVTKKG